LSGYFLCDIVKASLEQLKSWQLYLNVSALITVEVCFITLVLTAESLGILHGIIIPGGLYTVAAL